MSSLAREAEARYASFVASDTAPAIFTARVEVVQGGGPVRATPTVDVRLRQENTAAEEYRLDAPGFRARIDLSHGAGELTLDSAVLLADLEHFLRVVVALLAFREDGLLIHAAGLRSDGRVRLFIGQSGSGKSTAVALSPHALALNDDLIVLRSHREGWTAYGTPFWNMETSHREGETACGPLTGIYKLVQDSQVYAEALSPAAATAELVANCPVINGSPSHLSALLLRCRQLASAVPVQRLHFRKDSSFWQILQPLDQYSKGNDHGIHRRTGSRSGRDGPAD
jgi:hypothetical protein